MEANIDKNVGHAFIYPITCKVIIVKDPYFKQKSIVSCFRLIYIF